MPLRPTHPHRIVWTRSYYGPLWAKVDGVEVGSVNETAIEGRWKSTVRHTADWRRNMHVYVASEARARWLVEKYWSYHRADPEALQSGRRERMGAASKPLPRKPKGIEDRS